MSVRRRAESADRVSSYALVLAGGVCGVLVFVVALPLALSSPFPTPKQSEWILEKAAVDAGAKLRLAALATEPATTADDPPSEPQSFATRWDLTLPPRPEGPRSSAPPTESPRIEISEPATRLPPAGSAAAPPRKPRSIMEVVDTYLWEVYRRLSVKADSTGDFTWKDPAAAKRMGMSLETYVIGGMDPDFREQLYHAGRAMDQSGLHWSMLSAFRDNYRQALAAGFKAHGGNSLHGGTAATGGYGHGRAIDITAAQGEPEAVWHWIDAHGARFGLRRPMPGADPAHIQPRNTYHDLAHQLREARVKLADRIGGTDAVNQPATQVASRGDETTGHARR